MNVPRRSARLKSYLNEVWCCDCMELLTRLPDESIDHVISDVMWGIGKKPCVYGFGPEPFDGTPGTWWKFYKPVLRECRRVLKPGGSLAWNLGCNFHAHFPEWFGDYRLWALNVYPNFASLFDPIWLVQTRERKGLRYPDADGLILLGSKARWRKDNHPCPKSPQEMDWIVRHLTVPGEIILDMHCGLGTTLQSAKRLGCQWIGCDIWEPYCVLAKWGLLLVDEEKERNA